MFAIKPCLQQTNRTELKWTAPCWPSYTTRYWSRASASRSWLAIHGCSARTAVRELHGFIYTWVQNSSNTWVQFSSVRLLWTRLQHHWDWSAAWPPEIMCMCLYSDFGHPRRPVQVSPPSHLYELDLTGVNSNSSQVHSNGTVHAGVRSRTPVCAMWTFPSVYSAVQFMWKRTNINYTFAQTQRQTRACHQLTVV